MAAVNTYPKSTNPFHTIFDDATSKDGMKDEWEDWDVSSDDDSRSRPNDLIDLSDNNPAYKTRKSYARPTTNRFTQHRPGQLHRVKSRARQKAQNAKAGITLVTDMSQFRQAGVGGPDAASKNKFAYTPALQALEGKQSSPSIGSFAWLKRKPGNGGTKRSMMFDDHSADLSPNARPIVIGISVPSDEAGSHQVSPQTAVVETPMEMPFSHGAGKKAPTPQQLRSVWSPDTEDSDSPYSTRRAVSSVYSQYTVFGGPKAASDAPPVPALPATVTFSHQQQYDEDSSAPCTPFEEDDSPVATRKSQKLKVATTSPESASSRAHGWWDHITTPFTPQTNNPFKSQPQQTGSSSTSAPQEWWSGHDEKKSASRASHLTIITPASQREREATTIDAIAQVPVNNTHEQSYSEKTRALSEGNHSHDAPPPYEYTKAHPETKVAVPQFYINPQPVPSPGPITPCLPGTMTSQSGIGLADIPLTPSGVRQLPSAVLPDRVAGSYRTGDHFYEARGKGNKMERQRRRHEKEDVMARKVGGFWRGRGCIPEEGCFGRGGREGRKRRRVCLGIIGGVIAAIILIIVLVVVLTHKTMSTEKAPGDHPAPADSSVPEPTGVPAPTYFLNLTDFPPMPTGVLTVTKPKTAMAVSGCFTDETPSTAWSCAVPKENQGSAPIEFIFQIQYDNNTRELWKLADGAGKPKKGTGVTKENTIDKRDFTTDNGFTPDPEPPSLNEIRFLGNTTDKIKSPKKEGEPTPFFISLLESLDGTVGPNMLSRRQGNAIGGSGGDGTGEFNLTDILPAPELNSDGTGAPVRLFPLPVQQPLRLFDRDLPTEHYGFYTYFDKKIYLANSKKRDPADENGGVPIADAKSLVTFAQTRFLVKIWTRMDNATELLNSDDASSKADVNAMPFPITVIEDMHGGDPSLKKDFSYGVFSNMEINRADATLLEANIGFQGTLVNGRGSNEDSSLGGFDGGTGGCKCEWRNFESDQG
ncbi:hypothetical protein F5B22DRAFT_576239 [Xylaria bambusicola]|uniref:uncharacterized protein n=1 Tax=Xylaria bambusicola TaxID=326684 RepID=UPI002007ACFC|nr:uncharacterized protein F5B22DRAFT_576239 [Xylaria bambusicola]KAI0503058.1 hypothetical protein F5B22DRAFT_576239 [Xylaria bambusicola]